MQIYNTTNSNLHVQCSVKCFKDEMDATIYKANVSVSQLGLSFSECHLSRNPTGTCSLDQIAQGVQ